MLMVGPDGKTIDVTNGIGPESADPNVDSLQNGPHSPSKKMPSPSLNGNRKADARILLLKIKMLTSKLMALIGTSSDQSSRWKMGSDNVSDHSPTSGRGVGEKPGTQSFHITGGPGKFSGQGKNQGDDMSRLWEASPVTVKPVDRSQSKP